MRSDRFAKRTTSEGLAKTCYTAMMIASIFSVIAMIFCVHQNKPESVTDLLPYYLPWALGYGIPALLIFIFSTLGLFQLNNYIFFKKIAGILSIVVGSLIIVSCFPLAFLYQAWEFFFSVLIIGACVLAMGILEQLALKRGE